MRPHQTPPPMRHSSIPAVPRACMLFFAPRTPAVLQPGVRQRGGLRALSRMHARVCAGCGRASPGSIPCCAQHTHQMHRARRMHDVCGRAVQTSIPLSTTR